MDKFNRKIMQAKEISDKIATLKRALKKAKNKEKIQSKIADLELELKDANLTTYELSRMLLGSKVKVNRYTEDEFNKIIDRLSKRNSYSFLSNLDKELIKKDLKRKAKPVGWRFKGDNYKKPTKKDIEEDKGKSNANRNTYREYRSNRSDVIKISKLETGGNLKNNQMKNIENIEPLGYKIENAIDYGKKLVDAKAKTIQIRNEIEKHYPSLKENIQEIMNNILDYKDNKIEKGGEVKEGDIVTWENKKYKVGKEDKEIKNFYLLNMDGTYAQNPNGSSLMVHKSKLKKMAHGGGVENENAEMVLNNNKQIAHHTQELQEAVKGKHVPAWVVAKVNRSASDLSDATHYMEGQNENYATGGGVKIMPQQGTLLTKDKKLKLDYKKNGNNFEFVVYEGETNPVANYTKTSFKKKENGILTMDYNQFINYIYAEGYIDDKNYALGGGVDKKEMILYRIETLAKDNKDILTDKEDNLYIYEKGILYNTEDGLKKGTSCRMSKINLTILPYKEYETGGGVGDSYNIKNIKIGDRIKDKYNNEAEVWYNDGEKIEAQYISGASYVYRQKDFDNGEVRFLWADRNIMKTGGGVKNSLVEWYDKTYGKMTKKEIENAIKNENEKFEKLKKENPQLPYHYESSHIQNIQFLNKRLKAFENKMATGGIIDPKDFNDEDRSWWSDRYKEVIGTRPRNLTNEQLIEWANNNYKKIGNELVYIGKYSKGGGVENRLNEYVEDFGVHYGNSFNLLNLDIKDKQLVQSLIDKGLSPQEISNKLNKFGNGGVGGTFDSSSTGIGIGGTDSSSQSGKMIGGTAASSMKHGGIMGDIYSIEDPEQFKQIMTIYNHFTEKFGVDNYFIDHNDDSVVFLRQNNFTPEEVKNMSKEIFSLRKKLNVLHDYKNTESSQGQFKFYIQDEIKYAKGGGTAASSMAKGGGVKNPLYWQTNTVNFGSAPISEGSNHFFKILSTDKDGEYELWSYDSKVFEGTMSECKKEAQKLFDKTIMKTGGPTKAQQNKVAKVMHEWKEGELNIGKSDKKVKSQKQAVAIALSQAGLSKKEGGGALKNLEMLSDEDLSKLLNTIASSPNPNLDFITQIGEESKRRKNKKQGGGSTSTLGLSGVKRYATKNGYSIKTKKQGMVTYVYLTKDGKTTGPIDPTIATLTSLERRLNKMEEGGGSVDIDYERQRLINSGMYDLAIQRYPYPKKDNNKKVIQKGRGWKHKNKK